MGSRWAYPRFALRRAGRVRDDALAGGDGAAAPRRAPSAADAPRCGRPRFHRHRRARTAVGDFYLNSRLWEFADEQMIARSARADRGQRPARRPDRWHAARRASGPARLEAELSRSAAHSDACGKCHVSQHRNHAARLPFALHDEGKTTAVALKDADCVLRVAPTLAEGGRTRLQVVPEVMHGGTTLLPRPAPTAPGGNCTSIGHGALRRRGLGCDAGAGSVPDRGRPLRPCRHARPPYVHPPGANSGAISGDYSRRRARPPVPPARRTTTAPSGQRHLSRGRQGWRPRRIPTLTTGLPPALSQNLLDKPPPVPWNTDW